MIQINELTVTHRKDLRVILENFNLVLNDGDKAVIVGEEGNGKSTLMKWIYDPALTEAYAETEGERILGGERTGYLPQELPAADQGKTLYDYFAEEECFWSQTPKDLAGLAARFGVEKDFFYRGQRMDSLSGGEKVKAQLMRLLMREPTVLLLDEPSNDIDIATLELLEELINGWKKIVLYISHDETLIENTANMVIHLEQIRRKTKCRYTVAKMPYREYVRERLQRFEKQEQMAFNDRREKRLRDERYRRVYQSVEHAQATVSRQSPGEAKNLKDKMHTVKAMGKRFARQDEEMTEMPEQEEAIFFKLGGQEACIPAGKTVLEFELDELRTPGRDAGTQGAGMPKENAESGGTGALAGKTETEGARLPVENAEAEGVGVTVGNTESESTEVSAEPRVLARNIFLRIRGSEKICIIGANGAGKTTLLRQIADSLLKRTDLRAEYMPQNYEDLLDLSVTPVEYLDRSGDKVERTRIRTYLGSLRFTEDEMARPIRELSGGQKAKVLLLKMSLSDANVLILDEPTRNFSPLSGPVIRRMIREFPGAVLSISHDRKYIDEVCDTVYRLTPEGLAVLRTDN